MDSNTEELTKKVNAMKESLGMTGGARRRGRKASTKSRPSRKSSRASKRGGSKRTSRKSKPSRKSSRKSKGGAKRTSRKSKPSRKSSRKSKGGAKRTSRKSKPSRKSSRKSLKRTLHPALAERARVNRYIEKALGVVFSVGIAKLVKKLWDGVEKDKTAYVENAKNAKSAFDDYLAKHGKAKVLADLQKMNEEARAKRMKK